MAESIIGAIRGIFGISMLLLFCWLLSKSRRNINWKLVAGGMMLQFLFAVLILLVPIFANLLEAASGVFVKILEFSSKGGVFLFGILNYDKAIGATWAFRVLPTIVFFSALMSLLYYLGILQKIVYLFAWVMSRTMRLSGAESLAVAANIFVGQTEAPLIVRPYLERMTKSELACLMTGGMATIAGSLLAAYMFILGGDDPALQIVFGKRLIAASIMSAPAAIVCSKMLFPETEETEPDLTVPREAIGVNLFDAITSGTAQGIKLAVNVGAIVLVFIAFMAMLNYFTAHWIGSWTGLNTVIDNATDGAYEGLTLQFIFGLLYAPVAWLTGVSREGILVVGQLFGEGMILTQTVAYISMADLIKNGSLSNEKDIVIATFALCSFSNCASMGIQISGIGALAPGQRANLAKLALRALFGGTCACLMTATFAGMLLV